MTNPAMTEPVSAITAAVNHRVDLVDAAQAEVFASRYGGDT